MDVCVLQLFVLTHALFLFCLSVCIVRIASRFLSSEARNSAEFPTALANIGSKVFDPRKLLKGTVSPSVSDVSPFLLAVYCMPCRCV